MFIASSSAQNSLQQVDQRPRESVGAETALGHARSLVRKREYVLAEEAYERAVAIIKAERGSKSALVGEALIELGQTRVENGRSSSGISALREALAILEKNPGREAPITASCMNRLGLQLIYRAAFDEAESLLQEALQIRRKLYNDQPHLEIAASLGNLGLLYFEMGSYKNARDHLLRALEDYEKTAEAGSPYYIGASNVRRTLASLYEVQEDYLDAGELLEKVLGDTKNHYGSDSMEVAEVLVAFGELEMLQKKFENAERNIRNALKIQEAKLPAKHETLLRTKNSLAVALQYQGRYDEALELLRDLLEISGETLGENHPLSIAIQNNIGMTLVTLGEKARAREHAQRFLRVLRANLGHVLAYFPEDRRLGYLQNMGFSPYDLVATLGDGPLAAEAVLTFKGAVLESVAQDRRRTQRASGLDNAKLLEQIQDLRQEFLEAQLAGDMASANTLSAALEKQERTLSRALGEERSTTALRRTPYSEVSARLPENAVLLEYFFYDKHLGGYGGWEGWCGGVALARGREPVFRELGAADPILNSVDIYRELAANESSEANSLDTRAESYCRILYDKLLAPFTDVLPPDSGELLICPDGLLNFVSFATLLDSRDIFVGSRYQIRYLDTGRAILEENTLRQGSVSRVVLVGDPDFESGFDNFGTAEQSIPGRFPIRFQRLKGTAREVEELESLFSKHGWQTEVLRDGHATEAALRAILGQANIVHLATHGYFLPQIGLSDDTETWGHNLNPMLRGWLVFSGGNATLRAWESGRAPPPANDGILMADEVAALNLGQTELVALSACDTGQGETRNGEGILGLRRGFALSGVRNLLLTAWKIEDEYSARIMKRFYEAILDGAEPAAALLKIQSGELAELRSERGTLAAIHLAGPFLLTTFKY